MKQMVREHKILDKFGNKLSLENGVFKLNGKELGTVEDITNLIESGTVENAKPIYCHPIYFVLSTGHRLLALLFNNEPEAYNKETLANALNNIFTANPSARILLSGAFTLSGEVYIGAYLYKEGNEFKFQGFSTTSGLEAGIGYSTYVNSISDGVNKIN